MKTSLIDVLLKSLLVAMLLGMASQSYAQVPDAAPALNLTRYVDGKNGKFDNDGLKWGTAKNLLQETINSLHDYMVYRKKV